MAVVVNFSRVSLFVYVCVCVCVRVCVYLSVYLSVYLFLCVSVKAISFKLIKLGTLILVVTHIFAISSSSLST